MFNMHLQGMDFQRELKVPSNQVHMIIVSKQYDFRITGFIRHVKNAYQHC